MATEYLFSNGDTRTAKQLAAEIRQEGRLITDTFIHNGGRCVMGVIEQWQAQGLGPAIKTRSIQPGLKFARAYKKLYGCYPPLDNDTFVGTPQERCEYMAARVEALDGP